MSEIWTREEYHQIKGKKIYGQDDCPFCNEALQRDNTFWIGNFWKIVYNTFPYSGEKNHLMAIPKRHIVFSYELSQDEISELGEIYKQMKDFYWESQYFSFTRESMANRSVEHLHIHYLAGKLQGKYLRNMLMKQGFPVVQELE